MKITAVNTADISIFIQAKNLVINIIVYIVSVSMVEDQEWQRGWAGCGAKHSFGYNNKVLIVCVRIVSVLYFNNKFSPHTSLPVPLPTPGHAS